MRLEGRGNGLDQALPHAQGINVGRAPAHATQEDEVGGLRARQPSGARLAARLARHKPAGEVGDAVRHELQVVGRQPPLQIVRREVAEACGMTVA